MVGTATFGSDSKVLVVLRERYTIVDPPERGTHTRLLESFGHTHFGEPRIRLERTIRYSSPPDGKRR